MFCLLMGEGTGGSDGWVEYDARGETLRFRVACQEVGSNIVEASSRAGKNSRFVLDVPAEIQRGHPLDDGGTSSCGFRTLTGY